MRNGYCLAAVLLLNVFLSACANRGFYLSQQMPGVDKNLNVLPDNSVYLVNANGEIVKKRALASSYQRKRRSSGSDYQHSNRIERNISSVQERPVIQINSKRIRSTLDPANGALLLSE